MSPKLKLDHEKCLINDVVGIPKKEADRLDNYLKQILKENTKLTAVADRINKHNSKERIYLISKIIQKYIKRQGMLEALANDLDRFGTNATHIRHQIGIEKDKGMLDKIFGGIIHVAHIGREKR